jgi:hypothetical protein
MEYWVEVRLKSFSRPPVLALLIRQQGDTRWVHFTRHSPNISSVEITQGVECPDGRDDVSINLSDKGLLLIAAWDIGSSEVDEIGVDSIGIVFSPFDRSLLVVLEGMFGFGV